MKGDKVFDVGSRVFCQASFDSNYHAADVVEKKGEGPAAQYYIHYPDHNKRLDEWVPAKRLTLTAPAGAGDAAGDGAWIGPAAAGGAGAAAGPVSPTAARAAARKLTRNLKRRFDDAHHVQKGVEELAPLEQTLEKEHEEKTRVKNIMMVELGRYEVDTWYYSPFPDAYANEHKLFLCEFCLKYMRKKKTLLRHRGKCPRRHPPGDEIYRQAAGPRGPDGRPTTPALSMFEVDGRKAKIYCQNLCLLAKLFLDHKTLYYDVDPFLFYILCEVDDHGYHMVGYFSKEKSQEEYNLACILTLPPYQRKGYGRFLIAFAYELSKKEGKVGTPERPLSDLGKVSFRSYWTRVLLDILQRHRGNLSIKDISGMTAIRPDDIVSTLQSLNLIKYWKGQHIISVTPRILDEHLKSGSQKGALMEIDASKLHWTPLASPNGRRR